MDIFNVICMNEMTLCNGKDFMKWLWMNHEMNLDHVFNGMNLNEQWLNGMIEMDFGYASWCP